MRVAVLGCGPAGLLAAEAAHRWGNEVRIFSRKVKSPMPGAQYLHERIGDLTPYEPEGYLQLVKEGTAEGYAEKVYGDQNAPVSWATYDEGVFPAWSLGKAYDRLWDRWEEDVEDTAVSGVMVRKLASSYDVVFSSIPAPAICRGGQGCEFKGTHVWFLDRSQLHCPDDTIVYNGEVNIPWYRTSNIFGHGSTEFSEEPMTPGVKKGFKPTSTNCKCAPANVIRIGRFGKWDKQVLVHHVWEEVNHALFNLQ